MLKRCLTVLMITLIAAFWMGCTKQQYYQGESPLDANWGRSFEAAKFNQMLNPDADKNLEPVEGLDGKAAEGAIENYLKVEGQKATGTEFGVMTIKQPEYNK
jgi:hypothetical protein